MRKSLNCGARLMDGWANCLNDGIGAVLPDPCDGDSAGLGIGSRTMRMHKRRKRGAASLDPNIAQLDKRPSTDVGKRSTRASDGSITELSTPTITKSCQHALFRLTTSEKFVSLRKLLSENFDGGKADKILDFSKLNSRMKEGAYEQAPAVFLSDIQKVLRKVHVIGTEMVALSKSLSDMSRLYCRELAVPCVSDCADKQKQPDDFFRACRQCGEKSEGRDCLVCDSCEQMFHVSCIKPAVTKIPHICANCTALGIESPHKNCAVCESLSAPCGANEEPNENEEGSDCIIENGIQVFKGSKRVCCKACKSILENGELFRLCEDHGCNHYHHVRCLTNKQLKSFCSRWYCPCCLCRVCLVNKDDDKIVLCDACDHAYHIYCIHPPRKSIPQGKWYCRKCESGIQAIHKAKLAYKSSLEAKEGKKVKKRKGLHNTSG